jgi:FSR family fosmidomycin resistance protein-like MFS transporter
MAIPLLITYPWIIRAVPAQKPSPPSSSAIHFGRHVKPAAALLAYSLVRSGVIAEITILAPIIWSQHGGSLVAGAALDTVFIGVGIVGNLLGGTFDDRMGKPLVLWGTSLLGILTLAGFNMLHGAWEWPVLAVMGVALFGSSTTTMLVGQDIFKENPALGSGIALGLANALGAVMVFPLTYIAGRAGDDWTVWILIALTAVTLPAIGWMVRGRKAPLI